MDATTATTRGWFCWVFFPVAWLCCTCVGATRTDGATTGSVGAFELVAGTTGAEEWCVTTTAFAIETVGVTVGVTVGAGVAVGVAVGDAAGVTDGAASAGGDMVGFSVVTRRPTTMGCGRPSTCGRATAAAAVWTRTAGAEGTLMAACGTGNGRALTIAGAVAPWGTEIGAV